MTDREVGCMGKYWNIINLIIIAYINWGPRGDRKPFRWFRRWFLNEGTGQWSGQVKWVQSTRNENSGKLLQTLAQWEVRGPVRAGLRQETLTLAESVLRGHAASCWARQPSMKGTGEHCLLPASIALWCLPLPDLIRNPPKGTPWGGGRDQRAQVEKDPLTP